MIQDSVETARAPKVPVRTQERIDNIKKVVGALREGELKRYELEALLQLSPSGTRKYVADLRESGVLELARYVDGTSTYLGVPVFQLSPDKKRVDDFLAELDAGGVCPKRKCDKSQLDLAKRMAGRHFHIMQDDTHFAIRVSRSAVGRDPLVEALFGAPRAHQAGQVAA